MYTLYIYINQRNKTERTIKIVWLRVKSEMSATKWRKGGRNEGKKQRPDSLFLKKRPLFTVFRVPLYECVT